MFTGGGLNWNSIQDGSKLSFLNLLLSVMHNLEETPVPQSQIQLLRVVHARAHPKLDFIDIAGLNYKQEIEWDILRKILRGVETPVPARIVAPDQNELEMILTSYKENTNNVADQFIWIVDNLENLASAESLQSSFASTTAIVKTHLPPLVVVAKPAESTTLIDEMLPWHEQLRKRTLVNFTDRSPEQELVVLQMLIDMLIQCRPDLIEFSN